MICRPYLVIPFLIISILNLVFIKGDNTRGKELTKSLLMPLLILFYLFNTSEPNYLLVAALLFGFLGDVLLLYTANKTFLLGGIKAFLMGHVLYIIAFVVRANFPGEVPLWFYSWLLPYAGMGVFLSRRLFSSMGSMKLPGSIYMGVILLMSFTSLMTIFEVSAVSFLLSFSGSLFFIVSDTLLAFDMFKVHKQKDHVYIMATYLIAQLLITLSLLIKF